MNQVVNSRELAEVAAPSSEWARRVRELRDEEGWPILTNNDRSDLKPGEYLLAGEPPESPDQRLQRGISQKTRAEVLDRDGSTCQMCGLAAGDMDPITGRPARLHMGHIVDKSLGGGDDPDNLRTLCSSCNQGAKNITTEKPSWVWLLAQIRRSSVADQRRAFEWLATKFSASPIESGLRQHLEIDADNP